jgi:hypothetical protein
MKMEKIDLRKQLKALYNPPAKEVTLIDVPEMQFIMLDGQGAPESPQYGQSIEALYALAYTIKFARKLADGPDFTVMALEGLWWADDYKDFDPVKGDRNNWKWRMMIMQPDFITDKEFRSATETARKKKDNPLIAKVRFERFKEGNSVQMMHIGPYSAEAPNIAKMHDKIKAIGGQLSGLHHEIYLSDPRRADPSRLKTVLRQPYR